MICKSRRPSDTSPMIFGTSSVEGRFSKDLTNVVNSMNPEEAIAMGCSKRDIGSHSNRKGSVTYTMTLATCISAVLVYLRAGWSLGNVQDRYILGGAGGDQLVGRAVAGLPITDKDFAILPPHFSSQQLAMIDAFGWDLVWEGYSRYPECARRVIPFLLASIIFHVDWLERKLPADHPLFNQKAFTVIVQDGRSLVDILRGQILTGHGKCDQTGMQATGIPFHLAIAMELSEVKEQLALLQASNNASFAELKASILTAVDALPIAVRDVILENFQVNGANPVTMADITKLLAAGQASMLATISAMIAPLQTAGTAAPSGVSTGGSVAPIFPIGYVVLPAGFVFPVVHAKALWDLWFFGNASLGVGPYVLIHRQQRHGGAALVTDTEKQNLSRAVKVVRRLVAIAVEHHFVHSEAQVELLSRLDSDDLFYKAFKLLVLELYGADVNLEGRRFEDVLYPTLANKIKVRPDGVQAHGRGGRGGEGRGRSQRGGAGRVVAGGGRVGGRAGGAVSHGSVGAGTEVTVDSVAANGSTTVGGRGGAQRGGRGRGGGRGRVVRL